MSIFDYLVKRPVLILLYLIKYPKSMLRSISESAKALHHESRFIKDHGNLFWKTIDIDEVTPISEVVSPYTYLDGTSRPIDIAFLMALCRKYEKCHYLEIGSWRGESLANVAKVADRCTSISLGAEHILKKSGSQKIADQINFFSKDLPNVTHIEANSQHFDFSPFYGQVDVVFVDGDHSYEGVINDTQEAFRLLRNEKSIIVWHDCGNTYEGLRYEVVRAITDATPAQLRPHLYRVSNSFCGIFSKSPINLSTRKSEDPPNRLIELNVKVRSVSIGSTNVD